MTGVAAHTTTPLREFPVDQRPGIARRFVGREVRIQYGSSSVHGQVLAVARLYGYGNRRQRPTVLVLRTPSATLALPLSALGRIQELT